MAKDPIAAARAARDDSDRVLAAHNLALLEEAAGLLAEARPLALRLAEIAAALDPGNARLTLGNPLAVVDACAEVARIEAESCRTTLDRLGDAEPA